MEPTDTEDRLYYGVQHGYTGMIHVPHRMKRDGTEKGVRFITYW